MSTSPADRQRLLLIGVAAAAVGLAGVSLRLVKAAAAVAAAPTPMASFDGVESYLTPLPADTSVLAHVGSATMVVVRDPFALPRGPVETTTRAARPTTGERQHWVVSSILFEGSKRSAIVNNAWVTVGDALGGGYRLAAVERDHIVVTDANGVRHIVPIQGGES